MTLTKGDFCIRLQLDDLEKLRRCETTIPLDSKRKAIAMGYSYMKHLNGHVPDEYERCIKYGGFTGSSMLFGST